MSKIITHVIKFEKLPNYLEFFDEPVENIYIAFLSQVGGEI